MSDASRAENEFQKIPAIRLGACDARLGIASSILTGMVHSDRNHASGSGRRP